MHQSHERAPGTCSLDNLEWVQAEHQELLVRMRRKLALVQSGSSSMRHTLKLNYDSISRNEDDTFDDVFKSIMSTWNNVVGHCNEVRLCVLCKRISQTWV